MAILLIVISVCSLSSCYKMLGLNLDEKETAEKLVECFDKKDLDGAEKLFSKVTRKKVDVRSQLKKAFMFYDSKSLSTKYEESTSLQNLGDIDWDYNTCEMKVQTAKGVFEFSIVMFTYNDDDNKMGITELSVSKGKTSVDVGSFAGEKWVSEDKRISFKMEYEDSFLLRAYDDYQYEPPAGEYNYKSQEYRIRLKIGEGQFTVYKEDYTLTNVYDYNIILKGKIKNIKKDSFEVAVIQKPKSKISVYNNGDIIKFNLK